MEFFNKAKAVRLRSNHEKYLVADNDEDTVRQDRDGACRRAWWAVELVEGKSHVIRLRSLHGDGKYLTASDEPYLLGMTGKKVFLRASLAVKKAEAASLEWEPRTDGFDRVRLRSTQGKYLRANTRTPPWCNSITHDVPHRTKTQNWILWSVDVADMDAVELLPEGCRLLSMSSSLSSDTGSPMSVGSGSSGSDEFGSMREIAMELFQKARVVRLRSHHDKYLLADDDEESVCQDRNGTARNALWTVERLTGTDTSVLRLKSCFGKYLTASNMPFLLGMTGKKVLQTMPTRLDSSLEWEPIREGFQVRLRTRYGQFLRANGGLPPWRNSITHDVPYRTSSQDWILWDVDVVEIRARSPRRVSGSLLGPPTPRYGSDSCSAPGSPTKFELANSGQKNRASFEAPPAKAKGRTIHYRVCYNPDEDLDSTEEFSLIFRGSSIEELKETLKEETGREDIVICSRNLLNGKLHPLRVHLPPHNNDMHVVVVFPLPA